MRVSLLGLEIQGWPEFDIQGLRTLLGRFLLLPARDAQNERVPPPKFHVGGQRSIVSIFRCHV